MITKRIPLDVEQLRELYEYNPETGHLILDIWAAQRYASGNRSPMVTYMMRSKDLKHMKARARVLCGTMCTMVKNQSDLVIDHINRDARR